METKREILVHEIMNLIKCGELQRGKKLPPEREFAKRLGVSRSLLREALVTLECYGYLEMHGREGIFLKETDLADLDSGLRNITIWPEDMMEQLMEMRLLTEVPAAGLATERRNPEQMDRLRECISNLERIHINGEQRKGEGAYWDSMLHTVIIESANNRLLSRVYEGLSALMEKYIGNSRRRLFPQLEWPEKILKQHKELAKAIEEGNRERAEALAREHIYEAMKQLKVFH